MTKVAILGGGGHAKVLINAIKMDSNLEIVGVYDTDPFKVGQSILDVPIAGNEEAALALDSQEVLLVNGLGTVKASNHRHEVFMKFKEAGFDFLTVVHPLATIAESVELGEGVQIMAGVVIQPGCTIANNSILNTSCSVDHDCHIEESSHIAPGVTLSGNVNVGEQAHVGTGANIIQGVRIGSHATVAAGATVVSDVANGQTVKGCPAK